MDYHNFSVEKLYHFRCWECNKWWTIADWKVVPEVICPHCGRVALVSEEEIK